MKIVKVKKEPSQEYSWNTWCVQNGCHCDYLAGFSSIRCKECNQKRIRTEYVIAKN